jgi:hypothetical protein
MKHKILAAAKRNATRWNTTNTKKGIEKMAPFEKRGLPARLFHLFLSCEARDADAFGQIC